MLAVNNCLVSDEIRDVCFCCDLSACKGCCCIEGDMGAPLEEEEISILEDNIEKIFPFMTNKGIEIVKQYGVFVPGLDEENDFVTPLVNNRDCAFLYFDEKGFAKCSIETAFNKKVIDFNKPISCHLYPIRLSKFGETIAVNYDKWDICNDALKLGKEKQIRVYQFLKEPLIRRFGSKWYDELQSLIEGDEKSE